MTVERADARIRKDGASRTNREMSEATRLRILEATLDCLTESGYASTSTHNVVRRAGVTRGALTHHYSSKAELVAEAAAHLVRCRAEEQKKFMGRATASDLRERIRSKYDISQKHFPAMIEFMVAARTDDHLRDAFSKAVSRHFDDESADLVTVFPEFSRRPDPLLTQYVVNCFVRGLSLETIVNPEDLVERIFDEFVSLLTLALSP